MRIVHFLNHTRRSNGHVNVAVDLACVQARMGHEVMMISAGGDHDELLTRWGVQHVLMDHRRTPANLVRLVRKLRRTFKAFQPEIVHAHMMTSALLAFLLRPWGRYRLVTTVHNDFERGVMLMALGDRVIAVSEAVRKNMQVHGTPKSRLRVSLNGAIGTPRLSEEKPEPEPLPRPGIAFVGGLHPRKGVDDLIRAFKIVAAAESSVRLNLVGNGPYRAEYERLAVETGFGDRITFFGRQADPRRVLLASDIFVLPSHAEPAGLVLIEARDCGCAVVATQVGGIPEMLDGGQAGLLVPPRRPDLLAEKLIQLLRDPVLLRDLQARARKNLDFFTVQRATDECLAIYREVIQA